MPPAVSNATDDGVSDFPYGAHLMTSQEGWQEIADDVLDWALEHAVRS
jgi:hypothetical protein